MADAPTPQSIARGLTVPERLFLLCLASDTDWQKAPGLTPSTAQRMLVRGLIECNATSYRLTDQGRAVLDALLAAGKR